MSDRPVLQEASITPQRGQESSASIFLDPSEKALVPSEKALVPTEKALVPASKALVPVSCNDLIDSVKTELTRDCLITRAVNETLQAHRSNQFTGVVYITASNKLYWKLYFYQGKFTWALAQTNQRRSWYRQLKLHFPELLQALKPGVDLQKSVDSFPYWEISYGKLIKQVHSKQLDKGPFAAAVEDYLAEILFDILQEGILRQQYGESPLSFKNKEKPFLESHFLIVRSTQAWAKAQAEWQAWQDAELLNCSPNLKPVISKRQQLKEYIPEEVFECLLKLIEGNQCLRDLAVDHGAPLLPFTKRIYPFVQQGMIGLVKINALEDVTKLKQQAVKEQAQAEAGSPDAKSARTESTQTKDLTLDLSEVSQQKPSTQAPSQKRLSIQASSEQDTSTQTFSKQRTSKKISTEQLDSKQKSSDQGSSKQEPAKQTSLKRASFKSPNKRTKSAIADNSKPLIVYIEDSHMDSRAMEKIVRQEHCRYFNIQEPIHAIPLLIEKKPQLIFLDLVMPIANGYEICAQIRRVSLLKKVPIIIVTSNSGIIDRIRTKLKGASGFVSKPIERSKVLKVLNKHLASVLRRKA